MKKIQRIAGVLISAILISFILGGCMEQKSSNDQKTEDLEKIKAIQVYLEQKYDVELDVVNFDVPKLGFNETANSVLKSKVDFSLKENPNIRFWASQLLRVPEEIQSGYLEVLLGEKLKDDFDLLHESLGIKNAIYYSMRGYFTDLETDYDAIRIKSLDLKTYIPQKEFSVINYTAVIEVSDVEEISSYLHKMYDVFQSILTYDSKWYTFDIGFVQSQEMFKNYVDVPALYATNGFENQKEKVFAFISFNEKVDKIESYEDFKKHVKFVE